MSLKSGGEVIGSRVSFSDDVVLRRADQREARQASGLPLFSLSKKGFDFWFWFFPKPLASIARFCLLASIARFRPLASIACFRLLASIACFRLLASIACFRLLAPVARLPAGRRPTGGAGL
jgi:hypothetical protein